MISYSTIIEKFREQGEKTGWTYIRIPEKFATALQPESRRIFRVKGKLDEHAIAGIAVMPMRDGDFIMPLNAEMRKAIGKRKGATIHVQLDVDKTPYKVNSTFLECMEDEPEAVKFFRSLPVGHQNYFSKWIESAKTDATKVSRIAQAVSALSRKMGFPEMLRAKKAERDLLK